MLYSYIINRTEETVVKTTDWLTDWLTGDVGQIKNKEKNVSLFFLDRIREHYWSKRLPTVKVMRSFPLWGDVETINLYYLIVASLLSLFFQVTHSYSADVFLRGISHMKLHLSFLTNKPDISCIGPSFFFLSHKLFDEGNNHTNFYSSH